MINKKLTYKQFSKIFLFLVIATSYLWTIYGIKINNTIIWSINLLGLICNYFFLLIFMYFYNECKKIKTLLTNFLLTCILFV